MQRSASLAILGSNTPLFGVSGRVWLSCKHRVSSSSPKITLTLAKKDRGGTDRPHICSAKLAMARMRRKNGTSSERRTSVPKLSGVMTVTLEASLENFPCDSDGKICWTYVVEINHKLFRLGIPVDSEHWHSRSASTDSHCVANAGCTKDQHSEAKAAEKSEEF